MKTARRYNNVFDALYDIFDNDAWMSRSTGGAIPPINIIDSEEQYELEFAVPGMTKEEALPYLEKILGTEAVT